MSCCNSHKKNHLTRSPSEIIVRSHRTFSARVISLELKNIIWILFKNLSKIIKSWKKSSSNPRSCCKIKISVENSPSKTNCCKVSPPKRHIERIFDPTPAPIIKRIVTRLPTPDPSIIEVKFRYIFS